MILWRFRRNNILNVVSLAKPKHSSMAQSLSKIYIHAIFHVKNNRQLILPEHDVELYKYLGSTVKISNSIPIEINGTEDHVHVLCIMSKNISLAGLLEDIKSNSSRWIKKFGPHYKDFSWQGGYAGFSVDESRVESLRAYIRGQKVHHKKQSFKEEYVQFLKEQNVDFDPEYLWK